MQLKNFLIQADIFCEKVFTEIKFLREKQKKVLLFNKLYADHIGYRCSSHEEYVEILEYLIDQELITEKHIKIINNREITLVKLSKQASNDYTRGIFEYIEICDQKPDQSQVSGFDHMQWYYENDIQKRKQFITEDTYKFFSKRGEIEQFERQGYKKSLFKFFLKGTPVIISQGELLWDIALKSNPEGHTIL